MRAETKGNHLEGQLLGDEVFSSSRHHVLQKAASCCLTLFDMGGGGACPVVGLDKSADRDQRS